MTYESMSQRLAEERNVRSHHGREYFLARPRAEFPAIARGGEDAEFVSARATTTGTLPPEPTTPSKETAVTTTDTTSTTTPKSVSPPIVSPPIVSPSPPIATPGHDSRLVLMAVAVTVGVLLLVRCTASSPCAAAPYRGTATMRRTIDRLIDGL